MRNNIEGGEFSLIEVPCFDNYESSDSRNFGAMQERVMNFLDIVEPKYERKDLEEAYETILECVSQSVTKEEFKIYFNNLFN